MAEWFGADVVDDGRRVEAEAYKFKAVDADIPKTVRGQDGLPVRMAVRRAAPKGSSVKTSAVDEAIRNHTAAYKLARAQFWFSPEADKDLNELRMQVAFHEMQRERFLVSAAATGDPVQREHLEMKAGSHDFLARKRRAKL